MQSARPKSIQIEWSFFFELISFAYMHGEQGDPTFHRIDIAFHKKLEAMERHNLYTAYKTGKTEKDRQKARNEYLELAGILDSFRWAADQDINVTHNPDADLLP